MGSRYFNWKLGIVLLLGFVVLGITAFGLRQWQRGRRAHSQLTLGNIAYEGHNWEEAANQLGRYLVVVPDDVSTSLKYAEAQLNIRPLKKDNIQQAIAAYRNVLRLDANNVKAAGRLCEIYTGLNMPAEAELIATRSLQAGESSELQKAMVLALIGQRKYDAAAIQLKGIIDKEPQQIFAYELLGRLIEQRPKEFLEDPVVWFNRAITVNPNNAEALIARAAFFLRQARPSEAMADLTLAQQLKLSDSNLRLRLAEQLLNAGDIKNAGNQLEIASQTQSDNHLFWKLRARMAIQSGSKDSMTDVADKALKSLSSQPWDFMPDATELFIRAGQFDRAQECISKMRQKDIAPLTTAFLEGLLAENQGRLRDCVKHWRQAIELGFKSPKVRISLANALRRTGDIQSGINLLRTLISEQPGLFNARMLMAQLLMSSGQWTEAAQHVREARQIYPDNSDAALLDAKIRLQILADSRENVNLSQYQDIKATLDKLEPTLEVKLLQFNLAIKQNDFATAANVITDLKKQYPSEIRVILAESDLLVSQNMTDDAIEVLQKANVTFPRSPAILKHLSVLLVAKGQIEDCETLIKNAYESEIQPSEKKEFGLLLSDIYSRWGRNGKRYSLLNSLAIQLKDDIGIWREMLTCEEVLNDPVRAQQIVNQIRIIEGDDGWQWRYEQARIWLFVSNFKNQYSQIVSLLQENLLANPDDIASRTLLAMAYEKAGDQRLAVSTYTEALARAPVNINVMSQAATAFYRAGEYDKVDEVLRQVARVKLYHPDLERLEVQGAIRRGDITLANNILEKMLGRDPNNLLTGLSLAMLKIHQDNLPAARELVQKLMAGNPNSITAAGAMVELDIRMREPQEALEVCDEMVKRLNSVSARLLRAKTLAILNKPDKAKEDFEKAVTIEPNNTDAWIAKSAFHLSMGESDEAVRDIRRAMSIMPANLRIQKAAISLYLSSDDRNLRKEGESILESAIAANPADAELGLQKAKLLLAKNTAPQIEQAYAILQSITERQPQVKEGWLLLAQIALQDSRPSRAIDACLRGLVHNPGDRALLLLKAKAEAKISPELAMLTTRALWEIEPNNADIAVALAEAYISTKKYDEAIKLLSEETFSSDLSQQRKIKAALAEALYKNNKKAEAEKMFDELHKAEPDDPRPLLKLIRLLEEDRLWERLLELVNTLCNDYTGSAQFVTSIADELASAANSEAGRIAEEFLNCVLQKEPNSTTIMIRLASLLQTLDRPQEAVAIYKRILEQQPDNIVAINNLAWILCEKQNNYSESLKLAKSGLEISPDYTDLIDTHGMALYRLGRLDLAAKDFEKCVSLYPAWQRGIVASYFHLGRCLAKLGEKNKAIQHLNKAIELNKDIGGMTDEDIAEANRLLESLSSGDK
jgi:tetratricopeptide (TPR) repeat protein